jgi:hypothetical protein
MDKDDLIRHLDRTLRIRAMFAFEEPSPEDEESAFLREAVELVRSQPIAAAAMGAPASLLGSCLGDC